MYKTVIVDDEWWVLQGISKTFSFSKMGFEVVLKTTDTTEALKFIIEKKPELVITDIRMPDISGLELIEKVRGNDLDTEFIILSGYAQFSYAQEAIRKGAFDYCLKPIKKDKADKVLTRIVKHLKIKEKNKSVNIIKKIKDKKIINEDIDNKEFRELLNYIDNNFDRRIYLKDLAKKFGYNTNYCCYLFNKYLNNTFSDYLTDIRMKKSIELLKKTTLTIKEIAGKTGYSDYFYFNKVFKKEFGFTPTEYRSKIIKNFS